MHPRVLAELPHRANGCLLNAMKRLVAVWILLRRAGDGAEVQDVARPFAGGSELELGLEVLGPVVTGADRVAALEIPVVVVGGRAALGLRLKEAGGQVHVQLWPRCRLPGFGNAGCQQNRKNTSESAHLSLPAT